MPQERPRLVRIKQYPVFRDSVRFYVFLKHTPFREGVWFYPFLKNTPLRDGVWFYPFLKDTCSVMVL